MKIQLSQLIGEHCITAEQGKALLAEIEPRLLAGEKVVIDLAGVRTLVSLFLNNGVGPLFKHFDWVHLDELLSFENETDAQHVTLNHVLKNAEAYYHDPGRQRAVDETLAKILEEMD